MYRFFPNRKANKESRYHILAEKRTCTGQHRQNLLNKCPNMKKEHLSSLGPFFFLFLLPFFTCTVQSTCSRIKCMVLISCVHGALKIKPAFYNHMFLPGHKTSCRVC